MNLLDTLSFESTEEEGDLWFRLLVNGKDLTQEIQGEDGGIHYSYVEGDLPTWPPGVPCNDSVSERMISVCSCGEYGCGSTRCIVDKDNHEVVFHDFDGTVKDAFSILEFRFSRGNYDEVVGGMSILANAYREKYKMRISERQGPEN